MAPPSMAAGVLSTQQQMQLQRLAGGLSLSSSVTSLPRIGNGSGNGVATGSNNGENGGGRIPNGGPRLPPQASS